MSEFDTAAEFQSMERTGRFTDEGGSPLRDFMARIKTGLWLDTAVFPPLQWAVPGLIAEGMTFLVGPPKLGKSWFALSVGLSVAIGERALGVIPVQRRHVLYMALEDGDRRMQFRARQLLAGESIPEWFEYLTDNRGLNLLAGAGAWLDTHPGGLVMLDTLGKIMPDAVGGETAYQRDYRIGGALKAVADDHPGSAVLVVHHTRKMASGDFMDATSGTNGLNGAADATIVLERARGEGNALVKISGRDVNEGEYAARMVDGAWMLDGADLAEAASRAREQRETQGLGDDSARVVAAVAQHPEGATPGHVAQAMGWESKKAGTYLGRLADAGRIRKVGRGTYTSVESVESVESGVGVETVETSTHPLDSTLSTHGVETDHPLSPALSTHSTLSTPGPEAGTKPSGQALTTAEHPRWGTCTRTKDGWTPQGIKAWNEWRDAGKPEIHIPAMGDPQ